jgi:hypothetical protein
VQNAPDFLNVKHTAADVVNITSVDVEDWYGLPRNDRDRLRQRVNVGFKARADIEDLADSTRRQRGQQGCFHGVLDKGEVTRLLTIAVDRNGFAFDRGLEELGYDAAIRVRRALARAVDIRVTYDGGRYAVRFVKGQAVILAGEFADSVGKCRELP